MLVVRRLALIALFVSATAVVLPARAQVLVATYQFNNNLAADQPGRPALVPTDPLGLNAFVSDTVFGQARTVYLTDGNASPVTQQAGLTLNTTGLVPANNYSVEMVFEFLANPNAWRRIIDVQNRASDNGFYVDSGNQLDVFPVAAGGATFTNGAYHHVVLTDASTGTVKAYLDGALAFTASTTVMDINNAGNLMNFFLDNTAGGGQGEYSDARTALIRLYSGVLSDADVRTLAQNPFVFPPTDVPEPGPLALMLGATAGCVLFRLRRRQR